MDRLIRSGLVLAALVALGVTPARAMEVADYQRAAAVHDTRLRGAIDNAVVTPHWLPDGRFWYTRRDRDGAEQRVLVDPAAGARQVLAADHPLQAQRALAAAPARLQAPVGGAALEVRDNDLWLIHADGRTQALTHDGDDGHGYGVRPDWTLRGIARRQATAPAPPFATWWSPDARHVFGVRYDERHVALYPYLDSAPDTGARPRLHQVHLGLPGDSAQVASSWFILDVDSGAMRTITPPHGWQVLSEAGALGWRAGKVYSAMVRYDGPARLQLVELDLRSGQLRPLLEERSATRVQLNLYPYSRPAVTVLAQRGQLVWFSQRDGWGHLYLLDLVNGGPLRQLTRGRWNVRDIVGVDESGAALWVTGSAVDAADPYLRQLYRVPLDGSGAVALTDDTLDHAIDAGTGPLSGARAPHGMAPHGRLFIDTVSSVSAPPRTVLRSGDDGRVHMVLEDADVRRVYAAGWRAPQRVQVVAADGRTPLMATVYLPPGYHDGGRYPVVDAMYGGVFIHNAPTTFADAVSAQNPVSRASLAELGFVVVTVDARGTGGREKAFTDASFNDGADTQLEDHVHALRQLAGRFTGMDLQRVGIYGHSFGGYSAARALLRHPDFYKVGVPSAGSHNLQGIYGGAVHGMDRLFVGMSPDGTKQRLPALRALDNAALADQLRGRLLLVYGELDENAPPALTLQLAAAFNRANKPYDLLYLANQDHELFRNDAYYTRRLWDYFVLHLAGQVPPANAPLAW